MPLFTFENIKITAVAASVPTNIVTADSFKSEFGDEQVERFKAMTGIKQFRKTRKYQTASDLGYVAAKKIIEEKEINRDEIGALIFVTHSTDYRRPATACVLHKRLGLAKNCATFDMGLGCSAVVYGLQTICSLMQCSDINKAMLIVGETLTKMAHPRDKSVAMLFGDGGGAFLLEKTAEPCVISGVLKTDGNGYKSIIAPAGGFRNIDATHETMMWQDGNERTLYNTYMNGTDVFNFTIRDVPQTVKEFLETTATTVDDYDCFAFHQANQFILKQLSKKLKIPTDKMLISLDRFGNTSAPAIALTLCDRYGDKNENSIDTLMCGFGVGLSWGVLSATIDTTNILPIIETDDYFAEGVINSPEQF